MDRSWLADLDPDLVKPGVLGLVVVLALVVATALLLRSFTRQLKKIDFDEDQGDGEEAPGSEGGSGPRPQDQGP
jgi:hypothetical protein